MTARASATALSRRGERVRAASTAPDERLRQGRGDLGAAPPARRPAHLDFRRRDRLGGTLHEYELCRGAARPACMGFSASAARAAGLVVVASAAGAGGRARADASVHLQRLFEGPPRARPIFGIRPQPPPRRYFLHTACAPCLSVATCTFCAWPRLPPPSRTTTLARPC